MSEHDDAQVELLQALAKRKAAAEAARAAEREQRAKAQAEAREKQLHARGSSGRRRFRRRGSEPGAEGRACAEDGGGFVEQALQHLRRVAVAIFDCQ